MKLWRAFEIANSLEHVVVPLVELLGDLQAGGRGVAAGDGEGDFSGHVCYF